MLKLSDHLYLIEGPRHAQYPYSNFLYVDDGIQALIDTGWGSESFYEVSDKSIDLVLNSHFHLDHRGNNNCFPGAQVWAHHLDAPAIRSRKVFTEYYGLDKLENGRAYLFDSLDNIPESAVHKELEDNARISLGEIEIRVIHTPGHSPGHCAFYCQEQGILYGGDIDLSKTGPFYGNVASNIDDFIESIKKLRELNPQTYISAHRGVVRDNISGRLDQYLNRIYEREEEILERLALPKNIDELTMLKPISGAFGKPQDLYFALEMVSVHHHLERLIKAGHIVRDNSYYIRV